MGIVQAAKRRCGVKYMHSSQAAEENGEQLDKRTESADFSLLYIGGEGRSGSTVLEKALAAHPDVAAVGELKYLWKWGIKRQELCACGKTVPDCEFWSGVGQRMFGPEGFESAEAKRLFEDYETVSRNWRMGSVYLTTVMPHSRARLKRVRGLLATLYAAIAAEAGVSVVIDASKHPMHLAILMGAPGLRLSVLHLVRDPCGVANSWSKEVPLPHDPTGQRTMGPHPTAVVVARWSLMNIAVSYVRHRHQGRLLRYEDFCREPKQTIAEILTSVGLDPSEVPETEGASIATSAGHGIAGNPARFGKDVITLTEDNGWRERFTFFKQAAIKTAVLPQALLYRYVGKPK